MKILEIRQKYHLRVCQDVLRINRKDGILYPNNSDSSSKASVQIGLRMSELLGFKLIQGKISEQTIGNEFEEATKDFIEESFELLAHIRPGDWIYSTKNTEISGFDQYSHLRAIEEKIKDDKELTSALGRDYLVKPDIIVAR